jgi:CSLREA domain-containing protein
MAAGVRRLRNAKAVFPAVAIMLLAGSLVATSMTGAAPTAPPACSLVPQLRDVTINQGLSTYSPFVNGKETLARLYLSLPSCAGSGASIQVTGGTLEVKKGTTVLGTVGSPTPTPSPSAYPTIATFSTAPMTDSTGDPKFVIPPDFVDEAAAFTATFKATIRFQFRASRSAAYTTGTPVVFTNRPGTSTPIQTNYAGPTGPLSVLFVPMGDATRTYSSQWTSAGQQALQDGITATLARTYPLPAGIGNLGGTGGFRYTVAPTLLDLKALGLLDANGKLCASGTSYDLIKGQLSQFLLSHNTVNPSAKANRVIGVVDPAVALSPDQGACFEGLAVIGSQAAWARMTSGRAGQIMGLELAHTLGLTPESRDPDLDGGHSPYETAENPPLNRRYNLVQRSFIPADRSLLKGITLTPSLPTPDNVNTLLEVPDYAFLLCLFGGPTNTECTTTTQSTLNPVGAGLAFVMSGTTDSTSTDTLCQTCTGSAAGTDVVESYFSSNVPLTAPSPTSEYRLVQRNAGGGIIPTPQGNQGVPVTFRHSEHGAGSGSETRNSGLFSFALPFGTLTERIELWKGTIGPPGFLIYARNRTAVPSTPTLTVSSGGVDFQRPNSVATPNAPVVTQAVETLAAEATLDPSVPAPVSPGNPASASVSFGNTFSAVPRVCFTFHFIGDLLDPGDFLFMPEHGGFQNPGTTPQQDRTICSATASSTDRYLDGTDAFTITMEQGSVTVGALTVTVIDGDTSSAVAYRISATQSSNTVTAGGSISVTTSVTDAGDTEPLSVALTGTTVVPSGSFSTTPASGTPTFTSDGTLSTSSSTSPGTYWLVITAKSGSFTRSVEVPLTVTAAPSASFDVNTTADDATDADMTDGVCEAAHCTLREAIRIANASSSLDTITFSIGGGGHQTIMPATELPDLTQPVTIDGTTQEGSAGTPLIEVNGDSLPSGQLDGLVLGVGSGGSTIEALEIVDFASAGEAAIRILSNGNTVKGNRISGVDSGIVVDESADNTIGGNFSDDEGNQIWGFSSSGIEVQSGGGNVVAGNTIGVDPEGSPSGGETGISVSGVPDIVIGHEVGPGGLGDIVAAGFDNGNVIAGATGGDPGSGISLVSEGEMHAIVAGNFIGQDRTGESTTFGNGVGIRVFGAFDNQLGPGNTIADNQGPGVEIDSANGNRIVANFIHSNGGLGIDLGGGGNDGLVAPELFAATLSGGTTTVEGQIDGAPFGDYFVEFFSNASCDDEGSGEGESYLEFHTVNVDNEFEQFSVDISGLALGDIVTATITDASTVFGNTSEFSNCVTVEDALPEGQVSYEGTVMDDNPEDNRADPISSARASRLR